MKPGPKGPNASKAQRAWKLVNQFSFMDLREFLILMFPNMKTDERTALGMQLIERMISMRNK
jgi:hypothetical protein